MLGSIKHKTLNIKKIKRVSVLGTGLEPVRTNVHWILSPTCLPIPPPERDVLFKIMPFLINN